MAHGHKFYIHGGGRWREVDLSDGRVEGWGRARFVYPRRGKVQVAKSRAVLAALREMSAGQNSAVKDGAHLLNKKIEKVKAMDPKEREPGCANSHCCHSSNNNGCNPSTKFKAAPRVSSRTQCVPKADVAIQTSQTLTYPETFNQQNSRKRRRETTSSDENVPTKIITTATIHTNTPKKVPSLKLDKADSAKYNIYKRRRSKSSDSVVWVVLPKYKRTDEGGNKLTKISKVKTKSSMRKSIEKDSSGWQQTKLQTSQDILVKNDKQLGTQRSVISDVPDIIQLSSSNFKTQATSTYVKKAPRREQCKELDICEDDIEVLRNYLLNHSADFDLLKFDQDDEYKKHFFFKINPLVSIERSPIISRMLRRQSQSEISLKDFASQLGLRSVSDKLFQQSRYQMRKRNTIDRDSDFDTDNENLEQLRNKLKRKKIVKNGNTNFAKARMLKKNSRRSGFESDKEFRGKQIKRSDRLMKESNRKGNHDEHKTSSKRYKTRNSIDNNRYSESSDTSIGNKRNIIKNTDKLPKDSNKNGRQNEVVEIFSSNTQRKSRSDVKRDVTNVTDSDWKVETSQKSNRSHQNQVNKNKNNLDLMFSSSEDEPLIMSEEFRRNKNKIKTNEKNIDSSEDTSEEEEPKLANRPNKRIKNKPNHKNINLDLTQTTSEDESVKLPTRKVRTSRTIDKRKYVDLASSNEESESDDPKSTRELRRDKSKISNHKKYNLDLTHTTSEEETLKKSAKDAKRQYKVNSNDKGKNTDSNEEDNEREESKEPLKNKAIKNKLNNILRADKDNSNTEGPNSKASNRGPKKDNIKARNNIDKSTSNFEVETPKESTRRENSKIENSKIFNTSKYVDNSEAEGPQSNRGPKSINTKKSIDNSISDSEVETPKESNRRGNNKIYTSKIENKRTTRDHSNVSKLTKDKESHKPSKETKNRINNSKTVKNRTEELGSIEDNLNETLKLVTVKNKEDPKSFKENRRDQNKQNATTETVEFSSDDKEVFHEKRNALKRDSQESKPTGVEAKNGKSKRPSVRPYSKMEDHVIVSWVSNGGRASCVNGNRIWRELQMDYDRIAGQGRTWHSLRNRYLRYILPGLGNMALPASHVSRLRAAAATGEIKSRKRTANERRNSIFELPPRGALSRRPAASRSLSTDSEPPLPPKRHKHDHTRQRRLAKSPSTSAKRLLRSSLASSPIQTRHSPRYSDITRRFANNHRQDESTPTASPTTKQSSTKSTETKKLPARNTTENENASATVERGMSMESSATKLSSSLRRSLRKKESPVRETDKSTERETNNSRQRERTRTKLFNPGLI